MPLDASAYEFKTDPVAMAKVQRETIEYAFWLFLHDFDVLKFKRQFMKYFDVLITNLLPAARSTIILNFHCKQAGDQIYQSQQILHSGPLEA